MLQWCATRHLHQLCTHVSHLLAPRMHRCAIYRTYSALTQSTRLQVSRRSPVFQCKRHAANKPQADASEASANKASISLQMRAYGSFFVGMVIVGIYIEIKKAEKREKKRLLKEEKLVVHTDPHTKGSAGATNLPLFFSRSFPT